MKEDSAKILTHNTKWIYITQIFSQLFGLITSILVIRKLEVDIFGTYNLLLNSYIVFQILALSATTNLFNRYIPELIENKEYRKLNKFIRKGFLYSTIIFTFLILMLVVLREPFGNFFNIPNFKKYLLAFCVYNFSMFAQMLIITVLRALFFHKKIAHITILNALIRIALYLTFLNKLNVSVLLYIESFLLILISIQCSFIYIRYVRSLDYSSQVSTKKPVTYKRIKRFGLLSVLNELGAGVVGKTSDYFIVAAMSDPFQVGLFAFAHKLFNLVNNLIPIKQFMSVIRPMFFRKFSGDYDVEHFRKFYSLMIKILIPVFLFPAIYFLIFGKYLIYYVFDPKYLDAYLISAIILLNNLVISFFYPVGLVVLLKEKMEYALYSKIVAVISIIMGIGGMHFFGLIGIVVASLIGNLMKNLIIIFFMRNYKEIKIRLYDFKNFFLLILLCMPFHILNHFEINFYMFVLFTLFFSIYFLFILIKINPFNDFDLQYLNSIANSASVLKQLKAIVLYVYNFNPLAFKPNI